MSKAPTDYGYYTATICLSTFSLPLLIHDFCHIIDYVYLYFINASSFLLKYLFMHLQTFLPVFKIWDEVFIHLKNTTQVYLTRLILNLPDLSLLFCLGHRILHVVPSENHKKLSSADQLALYWSSHSSFTHIWIFTLHISLWSLCLWPQTKFYFSRNVTIMCWPVFVQCIMTCKLINFLSYGKL